MRQRVQKIIAQVGLCSRRTAEEWMLCGRVTVNGAAARPGDQADPDTDCIAVDGKPLAGREKKVYLMLHKPRGYVTTLSDEFGRRTAAELVRDCGARVFPVGRLDMDSEGLLLFTNDGELMQRMIHPKYEVDKLYRVTVRGDWKKGTELLRQLLGRDKPLILEIEPPEDARTCRRKRFYERNGLRAQPFRHVQLPFQGESPIVPLVIMADRDLTAQQCRAFQQSLLDRVVRYTQYRKTLDIADIIGI